MIGKIPDLYATLGLKKDASRDDIRRAYRKLALKLHPDRNPKDSSAAARFMEIGDAYSTLSQDESRKKYDLSLEKPIPAPNYPVSNASVEVEIDARDFNNGADKTVTVSRPRMCPDCSGSGRINKRYSAECYLCYGAGCGPCEGTGRVTQCARCWATGQDRETTLIRVHIPPRTPPHGRQKFVAMGDLWGLKGPFYVYANVKWRVNRPGLIVR